MDRREVRVNTFKVMFQLEFRPQEEVKEVLELYCQQNDITKAKDVRHLEEKLLPIAAKREAEDTCIETYSEGWKRNRIGKAELAILRIAVYEILYDDTIPDAVAVNEAVEIAKTYAQDKAPGFINGVLAKVIASKQKQQAE